MDNLNVHISQQDRFILYLFCFWLLIDSINGFFLRVGIGLPISIIYKLSIIFLLSLRLLRFQQGRRIQCWIILYIVWQTIYYLCLDIDEFIESLQLLLKPLTNILIFFFMVHFIQRYNEYAMKWILKIFKYNFIIFTINIFSGLLGFGYHSYESVFGSLGFCGYFYALNELGGVCMAIFPFILYNLYEKGKGFFFIGCILIITLGFLIISKAAILSALVSVLLLLYYKANYRKTIVFLVITIILYFVFAFNIDVFLSGDMAYIQKALYAYDKGGLIELLLSSRQTFVEQRTAVFFNAPFFTQLFGVGGNRTVEMDIFDVLLNIGYVGTFIYFFSWIYLFSGLRHNRKNNDLIKIILASDLVLFGMSLFAGHIYFSSTAGLFIAMLNSLMFYKQNNGKKEKDSRCLQPISF